MKILHVTHSYWPATYFGGPIFSTLGLCDALAQIPEVELRVLSTDAAGPSVSDRTEVTAFPLRYPAGYDVYLVKQTAKNFAPRQIPLIVKQAMWANYILLTGTYSFHVIPTLLIARLFRKPLAWSPRGALLDSVRWRGHRRPLAKRVFEAVCRMAIGSNVSLVVTSYEEAEASRARVGNLPTFIVTNGVEVPPDVLERHWRPGGSLRLVSLGRLDQKKGIENLIAAMGIMPREVILTIYGRGDPSYEASLKRLVERLGLEDRVRFGGPVDGAERERAFAKADLFVLPSHSENFGMVVAEALCRGVPAIVSHGAPWRQINEKGAGVWVPNDPLSLSQAVSGLLHRDLQTMGQAGRAWMKKDFSWEARASELVTILRGRGY